MIYKYELNNTVSLVQFSHTDIIVLYYLNN